MSEIYCFDADVDQFPAIDVPDGCDALYDKLHESLNSNKRLTKWTTPKLRWYPRPPKKNARPDVVGCTFSSPSFAVTESALEFFGQFVPDCGELLPVEIDGDLDVHIFHLLASDVFPEDHNHSAYLGNFVSNINRDALRPLFRELLYADDEAVPGVYQYCTKEFHDAWVEAGLTGLLFEPFWPLDERLEFLVQRVVARAVAQERGRRVNKDSPDYSPMPKGKARKPKKTWKKKDQPTPEQLAAYLWQSIIDGRMNGEWLGHLVAASTPNALGITHLAAEAVTRLLGMSADRNVLCHLARAITFDTIAHTFATLEETGIHWPDGKSDWESLMIAMEQEATLGKDGQLGGWPPQ